MYRLHAICSCLTLKSQFLKHYAQNFSVERIIINHQRTHVLFAQRFTEWTERLILLVVGLRDWLRCALLTSLISSRWCDKWLFWQPTNEEFHHCGSAASVYLQRLLIPYFCLKVIVKKVVDKISDFAVMSRSDGDFQNNDPSISVWPISTTIAI